MVVGDKRRTHIGAENLY